MGGLVAAVSLPVLEARFLLLAAYHPPLEQRGCWKHLCQVEPRLPCGGAPHCSAWPSALQGTYGPLWAIPRQALTGSWASWASSSWRLCRRALGRTGCRVAGLGHRRTPAPSLGEGFSRELLALTALPFPGVGGAGQGGRGWEAGPTPLPGSVCSSLVAGASCCSLPCGHCPRQPQPLSGSPEPAQPPLPLQAGPACLAAPAVGLCCPLLCAARGLRLWASAVCPLLCASGTARSLTGSPPARTLASRRRRVCVRLWPSVRCPFPRFDSGACIFPVSLGSSWSSSAPWRPGLQYLAISAPRLRLCTW